MLKSLTYPESCRLIRIATFRTCFEYVLLQDTSHEVRAGDNDAVKVSQHSQELLVRPISITNVCLINPPAKIVSFLFFVFMITIHIYGLVTSFLKHNIGLSKFDFQGFLVSFWELEWVMNFSHKADSGELPGLFPSPSGGGCHLDLTPELKMQ
ncbi:Integrin Beta-7 [Manis pentadactyla]|nr:Integrin Beta-7 [Manis pentadactyla]